MTDFAPDGTFSEFDLRRTFDSHAATIRPAADTARLAHGLKRADRIRTMRMAAVSGVSVLAVTFGVLNLNGTSESSFVDTVDQPGIQDPTPDATVPPVGDSETDVVTVETTTTTTTQPTDEPEQPDHLSTPTTTESNAATITTLAPTTSVAPSTSLTPTTTTTTQAPVVATTTQAPATTTPSPPPSTSTTTTTAVALTANARYGSCELDPPYDVYSGAATPGSTITVTSPYSDAVQTIAGADGTWETIVFFPTAPPNETFGVTISDGIDSTTLSFVHTE